MADLDSVRRHYANLTDEELHRIALHEVADLTPDGISILRIELQSRGFDEQLGVAVDAQVEEATPAKLAETVDRLRQLPCLHCHTKASLLNAFQVAQVTSVVFSTRYRSSLIIGCPRCVSQVARDATWRTVLFGWWGIPWGPIRTIQVLIKNSRAQRAGNFIQATPELLEYVALNPGEVALLLSSDAAEREVQRA